MRARSVRERGTVLYFHGGAYLLGSPETAASLAANLLQRTGITAVLPQYRLAPEHPFPAGIHDAVSAYRELADHNDPGAVVLAGDSAGGGLAIGAALLARDEQLPAPAGIVAFSPWLDATLNGDSMTALAEADPVLSREVLQANIAFYLASTEPEHHLISPAIRGDLTGLPPMPLQVGTNEVLLDDATRMAARAAAANVDVILDITVDVPHVFQSFTGMLDEADWALDRAGAFVSQRTQTAQTRE